MKKSIWIAVAVILVVLAAILTVSLLIGRRRDSWFYDLEKRLTAQYSSVERMELSIDPWGPTLYIYCEGLDLPSDSDAIVKDIIDTLRIGEDNLFQRSYTDRDGASSDQATDLDFTVVIYSGDSSIEYSTGYYLGYDHTESGTVDHYRTWRRSYNGVYADATRDNWFPKD